LDQQRLGKKGALRALALVRDEAPSLPNVVSSRARFYAWLNNTLYRLFNHQMGIVWRYVWAFIGGFMAMGGYAWYAQPDIGVLLAQRSGLALSTGLVFAICVGFVALFAGEFPARLRGFWRWWSRTTASVLAGTLMGTITWAAFTFFLLNYEPEWGLMLFGGLGMAFGYVLTTALRLPGWLAVIVTAAGIFVPLYVSSTSVGTPIVYFLDLQTFQLDYGKLYRQGLFIAFMIALGGHAQALWNDIFALWRKVRKQLR
jgi:hypothetical protein